ncbi:uncharacterized protein Dmoj_GI11353 [Drosophila mojavensis]|uniref:Uncharacterized protein n=1 Tax=Drosophila mojavensis TaxID=7230 RepID=A0A0Q9XQH4_DROMO|nr:uncharacterized protein Dmoj_GI11353 [Drosophila mojavensis]
MDIKNDTKQKGLEPQTQVRELFGREHAEKSRRTSSSSKDNKIISTSVQVDALHKKIESEIGKLKNFRKSFLKDTKGKPEKTAHILTGKYEGLNFPDSSIAAKWQEVVNLEIGSPEIRNKTPCLRTTHMVSSPQSSSSAEPHSKPEPGTDSPLVESPDETIARMCGGCNNGCCDTRPGAYSIYQRDYCHLGATCPIRMSECRQCYPSNASCITCMSRAIAVPMPYSSNPCYQYPIGTLYQKLDMLVPQRNGCEIFTCNCPRNTFCKRTTDLNTSDFCSNWYPDPVATVNRAVNTNEIPLSKFQFTPKQPIQAGGKEKGRSESPPKNAEKIMKISYRQQRPELNQSGIAKDKMSVKNYGTVKKKPADDPDINAEKLRMHREYMEMYKTEHKKTANKDSSQNNSELDTCPTYTRLPVENENDARLSASYIKEIEPSTNPNLNTVTNLSPPARAEDGANQTPVVNQINAIGNVQQIAQSNNDHTKSHKLKNLSVKRDNAPKKLSPIIHEFSTPGLPDSNDKNVRLIWPPAKLVMSDRSAQSPMEETQTDNQLNPPSASTSQHHITSQSCQTSPKNQLPTDRAVLSDKSLLTQTEETQANIPLNHPQLLTTLISNQSSQTSPRNPAPSSLQVWTNGIQSQVQETQTDIRDGAECEQINADQAKKASTFREETTFSKFDAKQKAHGNKGRTTCSARHASKIDKLQIFTSASSARNFIPWHTLRRKEGNRRMIENYKAMIQHKRVDTHTPESESNPSTTDTALPVTPNHCDGNYIDLEPGQSNLPAVSIRSDYQSSSQYPEPSNQAAQDDNTFEVQTEQRPQPFDLCDVPCGPSISQQQPLRDFVCTDQCIREKRRRSVTFRDESGLGNRSAVDWERLPKLSMERDTAGAQQPDDDNDYTDDDLLDSHRSTNTEFTCNESNYEDECSTFNDSNRDYIPPFTGCPCMYNEYVKLVAKCRRPNI